MTCWYLVTFRDIWWYLVTFHDKHVVYHDISWHIMKSFHRIQRGRLSFDMAMPLRCVLAWHVPYHSCLDSLLPAELWVNPETISCWIITPYVMLSWQDIVREAELLTKNIRGLPLLWDTGLNVRSEDHISLVHFPLNCIYQFLVTDLSIIELCVQHCESGGYINHTELKKSFQVIQWDT